MNPRIFCIPALRAPILAVLRRGPSDWFHLGLWDTERPSYEAGSWLRGTVYQQRCDLSPDGRWFCYFALKSSATWDLGETYIAISRLPWLSALAAWGIGSTWTRGAQFVEDTSVWELDDPDVGTVGPCRDRFGLALRRVDSFAVERRRGWSETRDTPPRDADDAWDVRRGDRITMQKPQPAGHAMLTVNGRYAAFREGLGTSWGTGLRYELVHADTPGDLEEVQWADWDARGRLLAATTDGRLQIREIGHGGSAVAWERDLASHSPDPAPPPDEAKRW